MNIYPKLIVNGIARHRKKGKRLFVLIAMCVAAIILALSFRESFYLRYVDLVIDTLTAHINIVSPASPSLKNNPWVGNSAELPIIRVDEELKSFIENLDNIEIAEPVIETSAVLYSIEGEFMDGFGLLGMKPESFQTLFPSRTILEGELDFTYRAGVEDIPLLRYPVGFWEDLERGSFFSRKDFRYDGEEFDTFKESVKSDFASLLGDYSFEETDETFIDAMNKMLAHSKLHELVPRKFLEEYNWEIDDNMYRLSTTEFDSGKKLAQWNKKLLCALYPDAIVPIRGSVYLNEPMTITVPPAKDIGKLTPPRVVPVEIVGIVQNMPLFYKHDWFIDISALREYLELYPYEYTNYMIRCTDKVHVRRVTKAIEEYLSRRKLDYRVLDYHFFGRDYFQIPTAVKIVFTILISLFLVTVAIFIANTVLLALAKRRREIGTSISLGMSKGENIFTLVGEVFIVTSLSWIFGAVFGSLLVFLFSKIGIPGMIFFMEDRLYTIPRLEHALLSYVFVLPSALLAAYIPALRIRKVNPVELLREVK